MVTGSGKSVVQGIAYGKVCICRKKEIVINSSTADNPAAENAKFMAAVGKADKQLEWLYRKALEDVGKEQAMIFAGQRMILQDAEFLNAVREMIMMSHVNAAYAVQVTAERYVEMFAAMEEEYMKDRSLDVADVSERILTALTGGSHSGMDFGEPVILLADDLSAGDIMQMDKRNIAAFVIRKGSVYSHASILVRSMNIPTLIQTEIELLEEYNGKMAVVDGFGERVLIEPEAKSLSSILREKEKRDMLSRELRALKGLENVTSDGRRIAICANIGSGEEVQAVLDADADGIGLFRSEFVFMGRRNLPAEDEQFACYKKVLAGMKGKKVVIRTLDIGADKQTEALKFPREENPALGLRAIRFCLKRTDILKPQLKAVYRAAVYGKAALLFPMITSVAQVRQIKQIIEEVKRELTAAGKKFGEVELGIMIETPAAALISDLLAKEVDFFSLGTNDLTQYTLAVDRQNKGVEEFYDTHHEAVLRLIRMTVENGHKEGARVGICGELAADTTMVKEFIDMGVDELSVVPASVLKVRKAVREM